MRYPPLLYWGSLLWLAKPQLVEQRLTLSQAISLEPKQQRYTGH
jgi:hypothetical protein